MLVAESSRSCRSATLVRIVRTFRLCSQEFMIAATAQA